MRVPVLSVRALLRLFPSRFREEYGRDMLQDFADRWHGTDTPGARLRLWLTTLGDLLVSAARERRHSSFTGSARHPPDLATLEGHAMQHIARDIRHAARSLGRQPALTAFLVLTLAVGIGVTTAVFSVVKAVLLEPLRLPESGRLVAVWGRFDPESGFNFQRFVLSAPEFVDYRRETRTMSDVAAWQSRTVTVGGPGAEPDRVAAAAVSGNFFSLLRVRAARGRTFTAEEDMPGGPNVAIVSDGYWRSRFGSDPAVIGRTLPLNGEPTIVVGIDARCLRLSGNGNGYPVSFASIPRRQATGRVIRSARLPGWPTGSRCSRRVRTSRPSWTAGRRATRTSTRDITCSFGRCSKIPSAAHARR